jgi:hypothetical protein
MPPSPEVMPHGPLGDLLTNLLALRSALGHAQRHKRTKRHRGGQSRPDGKILSEHQRERPQPRPLKPVFAW